MDRANRKICPQLVVLQKFLDEELNEPEAHDVDAHISVCTGCQNLLDDLVDDRAARLFGPLQNRQADKLFVGDAEKGVGLCGDEILRPITPESVQGQVIPDSIGGYPLVGELGRGTFGIVFQALDSVLNRYVAIKVPHRNVVEAAGGVDGFLKEARTLATLEHPHIVRVYEAKQEPAGLCYVVSQFIGGRSLADRLNSGALHFIEAANLMFSLAKALQHAHERGVCHRDIKPANILLDEKGEPYLADFGLAMIDHELGKGPRFLGTPAYMSPEQARGEGHYVDGRTDIFSLGVVFFKMLTGRRPFLADSASELLDLIIHVDAPSVRQKNGDVPKELDRICAKSLARNPAARYRSAKDLAEELQTWLAACDSRQLQHSDRPLGPLQLSDPLCSTIRDAGDFKLLTIIGLGATGTVFRARQSSSDRDVALKYLSPGDEESRARFLNEIRALGRVEHPNIVRIYTSGSDNGRNYYAMELIDGVDLGSLLPLLAAADALSLDDKRWTELVSRTAKDRRTKELPVDTPTLRTDMAPSNDPVEPKCWSNALAKSGTVCLHGDYQRRAATILVNVARASHALHAEGIVHRNIKPDNIQIGHDGQRVVLMDLGIAIFADDDGSEATRTHESIGSLRYASPEQIIDASNVDHRADIYSLGATLWEMLTLRPLYGIDDDVNDSQAMLRIQIQEPETIRKFHPTVSNDLQAIAIKCLEKNRAHRYQNAEELANDLERFLQGVPVAARPVGVLARVFRRCQRRPMMASLTGVILIMALSLVATLFPWPAPNSNTIRIGIKPWVGFSPLVVAKELRLCGDVDLQFVRVRDTTDVRQKIMAKELDAAPYLIDSHAIARATRTPTKIVLQLDVSLTADAMVVREEIREFGDLRGKSIAYMHHEAPHFLLLSLCDKHAMGTDEFKHLKTESPKEAVDLFLAGDADAVVSYEPFLHAALGQSGARRLASAADEPGTIIDILTVREDFLESEPHKVKRLIAGWMHAVDLLQRGDSQAIAIACRFLGDPGEPLRADDYLEMAKGMRYSGIAENLGFFRLTGEGSNHFRDVMNLAQDRWDRHHHLSRRTDPSDGDGSGLFLEMYGP